MSNNLIEQFNFEHLCRVVQHKNGKQYCHTKGIIYSDLHNKFKELSQTVIDNTNYHIVFNNEYYLSDITSFLTVYINDSNRNIDLAISISTLQNIKYLDAILEQFNAKDSIEVYELFSDFFDSNNNENGRDLIIHALTEQYLLLDSEEVQDTLESFISSFLNSNYLQKIKSFFIENYNIQDFTDESLTDCLLSCFEDNYSFEKEMINFSDSHDFSEVEQEISELSSELKQGSLTNRNKLKKGF
ncbi:hypothetical protein BEL05_00710 [Shewanella colwelliana]|uniref:Uncharacterized protein n=1 Tax=Shewanella colwelliana TaxID=23 RepID=A0A1E5IW77_SHECO|nr:hypothetical protein [Shewanella colwelliana]OEG74153.1 hypothetical protein BEL05_00710 [Shewanella colwelliana]